MVMVVNSAYRPVPDLVLSCSSGLCLWGRGRRDSRLAQSACAVLSFYARGLSTLRPGGPVPSCPSSCRTWLDLRRSSSWSSSWGNAPDRAALETGKIPQPHGLACRSSHLLAVGMSIHSPYAHFSHHYRSHHVTSGTPPGPPNYTLIL